jgi:hypothetical protein
LTAPQRGSDDGVVRRRPLLAALALLVTVLVAVAAPTRVAAAGPTQEPDAPADDGTGGSADDGDDDRRGENPEPAEGDSIIPEPNSGREPEEAGDRGGALQVLVFVLIVGGVGGIAALVVRDARRSRAKLQADPGPSAPDDALRR